MFARAPVLGLCFFVSMNEVQPRPSLGRARLFLLHKGDLLLVHPEVAVVLEQRLRLCVRVVGSHDREGQRLAVALRTASGFGLYTMLPLPLLFGVWHTKERSRRGSSLAQKSCNTIVTVWALQVRGDNKMMIVSCTKALK